METQTEQERILWRIAKKRVEFKRHLGSYIIVNAVLWLIWYFTETPAEKSYTLPWPCWPMFGWGVGMLISYLNAYVYTKENAVQKEYEKLKNK